MRNILSALMIVATLAVAASTDAMAQQAPPAIYLGPVDCGATRSCLPPTSTGDVVQFNAAYGNFIRLYVNGVLYSSAGHVSLLNFDSYPLASVDGATALLTAHFTTFRTCTHSGRGQTCTTHYHLADGSVIR